MRAPGRGSKTAESFFGALTPTPPPSGGLDQATQLWIIAVGNAGGTVSAERQILVNDLIVGLKADGIWTKLDRLWLFAAENEPSALVDIVADSLATAVNSPTFTIDRGYNGDGATSYINSNYAPFTNGVNYQTTSAHYSIWDITAAGSPIQMGTRDTSDNYYCELNGPFAARINEGAANIDVSGPGTTAGWWNVNASGAAAEEVYRNGGPVNTGANALTGIPNQSFIICALHQWTGAIISFTTDQFAAASMGGSLSGADATNFYDRMRTYMTAVGVP